MPFCSVRFCGTNNMTEDFRKDNITFHRFPKDPALKLKWVLAIRLKKQRWNPSYSSVVCSRHFKEECYQWRNKRKSLLDTAVPTERLFIPYIDRLQNLYTKCKTQSSKPGQKSKSQEKPEADNVYDVPNTTGKLMICKAYRCGKAEYKTLRCYYAEDCDFSPLSDVLRRTAEATGVSKKPVTTVFINEPFIMGKNEASFKPMLDRDCQDPERLNEPAHEFTRLTPAPVPSPKVTLSKLPTPKELKALMAATVRKLKIANKLPPPPVSLVLLAPLNKAHAVADTAENLLVQHDNTNEHKLNHVYPSEVRPEMVLIKEEVIDIASDEQYKPEGITATDDNIPYTCDVEIPAVKTTPDSQDTYGQNYVLPMELPAELTSEMVVTKKENIDAELNDINNNVRDFSDKTGEIKMNPANNEIENNFI